MPKPFPTPDQIRESISAQIAASEAVFQVLGTPGSRVYNFSNANRSNSGTFDEEAVTNTFAESLEESLRRSDACLERLSSGR